MQAKNHDGSYSKTMPFSQERMNKLLEQEEVAHVEVFEGTPEELEKRNAFKNNLKVKKRYTKAPKNNRK